MELLSPLFNSASRNRRERARTGGQIKERANPRPRCADGLDPSQQATLACVLSDACVRPAIKPRIQDSTPLRNGARGLRQRLEKHDDVRLRAGQWSAERSIER